VLRHDGRRRQRLVLLDTPARPTASLPRRATAEAVGSAFLAMVVVGSGIAAQRLSPGATGLELLENALATGFGLYALIVIFADVSGAHLNPVVTLANALFGEFSWRDAGIYVAAQIGGCVTGALVADWMFALRPALSTHARASWPHLLGEVVATLGLLLTVVAVARSGRAHLVPGAVAAYIAAGYFFTSSTSFANPAITVGRMFTTSFSGVAPSSVAPFIGAQLVGLALAVALIGYLYPRVKVAA
jgi:glycerol uptake facilitator-like aquaporin